MEAGFLNFRDEEHFSDFSLPFEPHNLLDEADYKLIRITDNEYSYLENKYDRLSTGPWGTEQEINGDMAILPSAGVSNELPKIEFKDDYTQVLSDWQDHITLFQPSDFEEDAEISSLNMLNGISERISENFSDLFCDKFLKQMDPAEHDFLDEPDLKTQDLHNNYSALELDLNIEKIEQLDSSNTESPKIQTSVTNEDTVKLNKIKDTKQTKRKEHVKKSQKQKCTNENKKVKERKKRIVKKSINLTDNENFIDVVTVTDEPPALEAGDVKSLLEQFEASENSVLPETSENNPMADIKMPYSQMINSRLSTNHSQSINCKEISTQSPVHINFYDPLTKEVDRIKVSGHKKAASTACSQNATHSSGVRAQNMTETLSHNKPLKIVSNSNNSKRLDGLINLDHDYCSSAISSINNLSSNSEYIGKPRNSEKQTIIKNNGLSPSFKSSILKKSGPQIGRQMISLLKKSQLTTNPNESIVTTTNSLNNEVQNIIVQNVEEIVEPEKEKKPPRKKLNLAEYRSRREQYRSDNSRTNSPIQPMALIYMHHASTTTEPIADATEKLIWCEREIISILKPKADIEEEKKKPKPLTAFKNTQTYETVFDFPTTSTATNDAVNEIEDQNTRDSRNKDRRQRSYQKRKTSYSSSRSRSRSKSRNRSIKRKKNRSRSRSISRSRSESRSRSRSRSRDNNRKYRSRSKNSNCRSRSRSKNSKCRSRSRSNNSKCRSRNRSRNRSRSRSKSRRCSRTRRRRISHRRSSVSSNSSWSSRSRSNSISTSRSRSQYSRSKSRSRSRSRSSSRYSTYSRTTSGDYRYSSHSNFGRSRWLNSRSKRKRDQRRNYDRQRRHTSKNYRDYKDWSRSPSRYYRRPYDTWYDREKQRQVEERRVIYVGRLEEGITKLDLRKRFEAFGPVVDISIHFRERGDNYGFVTFAYKNDAYDAVEHGNDDPSLPRYDLCFGGRRAFCKVKYADLDGMNSDSFGRDIPRGDKENSFDYLLEELQATIRKRKV